MMKGGMAGLMKQAQQMQEKMQKMQEELANAEVTGQSGAGLVSVVMTGRHDVKRITLDDSLMQEDKEVLEDLIAAAVNDAVAWWKELLDQGFNPAEVVFAGDSAGGGLALACMLAAREQGLPLPAAAVLFSPWTDLSCSGETMRSKADVDVMFNPDSLPQAAALYLAGQPSTTPLASPLFADLHGLPPLMIHASEHEILLSDATRLHERALAQGVRSELHLKAKMPHVWPTMVMLPEARQTLQHCGDFIAKMTSRPLA